jgi:hypothetical protein
MNLPQILFTLAVVLTIASLAIDPDDHHPAVGIAHAGVLAIFALSVCCSVGWALGSVYFWLGAL